MENDYEGCTFPEIESLVSDYVEVLMENKVHRRQFIAKDSTAINRGEDAGAERVGSKERKQAYVDYKISTSTRTSYKAPQTPQEKNPIETLIQDETRKKIQKNENNKNEHNLKIKKERDEISKKEEYEKLEIMKKKRLEEKIKQENYKK